MMKIDGKNFLITLQIENEHLFQSCLETSKLKMFSKLRDFKMKSEEVRNTELTTFHRIIMWLIPGIPITLLLVLIYTLMNHIASIRRVQEAARRNVEMLDYFRRPGGIRNGSN